MKFQTNQGTVEVLLWPGPMKKIILREQGLKYYLHLNQRQTEGERRTAGKTEKEKKRKLKVQESSRAKVDKRKRTRKPRQNNLAANFDDDSHVYEDDRMSLHNNGDNDSQIFCIATGCHAAGERLNSGLKNLVQELDKDEEIGEKVHLAEIVNKVWQAPNALFKNNMKNHKKNAKLYRFNSEKMQ